MVTTWNYPTAIRFGTGSIKELPGACDALGIKNPLFVTDPILAGLDVTTSTLAILEESKVPFGVFSHIQANPVGADVERGVDNLRSGGHDGVIAFGGGAALDVGKAIALMAHQSRPLWLLYV